MSLFFGLPRDGLSEELKDLRATLTRAINDGSLAHLKDEKLIARFMAAGPIFRASPPSFLLLAIQAKGGATGPSNTLRVKEQHPWADAGPWRAIEPAIHRETRRRMVIQLATRWGLSFADAEAEIKEVDRTLLDEIEASFPEEGDLLEIFRVISEREPAVLDATIHGLPILVFAAKAMMWELVCWCLERFGANDERQTIRLLEKAARNGESFLFYYQLGLARAQLEAGHQPINPKVVTLVNQLSGGDLIGGKLNFLRVVDAVAYPAEVRWLVALVGQCLRRPIAVRLRPCNVLSFLTVIKDLREIVAEYDPLQEDAIPLDLARQLLIRFVENPYLDYPINPAEGQKVAPKPGCEAQSAEFSQKVEQLFNRD